MKPADAIAMLDEQIAAHGQSIFVKERHDGGGQVLPARAFVRGYKVAELVGGLSQGDSLVVLSPTAVSAWIGGIKTSHFIEIAGVTRSVKSVETVRMNDAVVRINVQVR